MFKVSIVEDFKKCCKLSIDKVIFIQMGSVKFSSLIL